MGVNTGTGKSRKGADLCPHGREGLRDAPVGLSVVEMWTLRYEPVHSTRAVKKD